MKNKSEEQKVLSMEGALEEKESKRKDNLRKLINLTKRDPDLEGTFVQDLFEVMLSGDFLEIKKNIKSPEEKVVGEMNNLNKSLVALSRYYANTERILSKEVGGGDKKEISPQRKRKIKIILNQIRGRFEVSRKFNHENIRERLEDPDQIQEIRLEMRSGNKIISKPGHNFLPNDLPDFLRRQIGVSLIQAD